MSSPFTQLVGDPSLKDILDLLKKDIFLSLNCHAIATVQMVNFSNQTLTATMNYSKTYYEKDNNNISPTFGTYQPISVPYPILVDCPFIVLSGGGDGSLTFPIASGDQCLIFFNDRDLDNWFAGARTGPVATNRLHSFSDGMALVGFKPTISSYDSSRVVLQKGDTKIALGSKINIQNNAQSLYTILNTLLSAIAAAVSSTGDTGIATIAAAASAANSSIGGLLD